MTLLHEVAAKSMAIDVVTCRVVTALREAHIEPIVLKGPSFAAWLYADGTLRPYNDTDLLVAPNDAADVGRALERLGYKAQPHPPGAKSVATAWVNPRSAGSVDVHTSLWLFGAPDLWWRLQEHTQSLSVGHLTVTALDDIAKTVHVVTHALQHEFREAWPNSDLDRAIHRLPVDTWRGAAALASEVGAYDAFALGLSSSPGGQALARVIGVERPSTLSPQLRLLAAGVADTGAGAIHYLGGLSGWRHRLSFLRAKLFPSPKFVESLACSTGKESAQPIVNYVRYWGRLLHKAPRALAVWYSDRRYDRDV